MNFEWFKNLDSSLWGDAASLLTAILAFIAIFPSIREYKRQGQVKKDTEERESRQHAAQLSAWIACEQLPYVKKLNEQNPSTKAAKKQKWGIIFHNASHHTFNSVKIYVTWPTPVSLVPETPKNAKEKILAEIRTLPPGDTFIHKFRPQEALEICRKRNNDSTGFYFAFPELISSVSGRFSPANVTNIIIDKITFIDNQGQQWLLDGHNLLTKMESGSGAKTRKVRSTADQVIDSEYSRSFDASPEMNV
ncbi:hypothetical protein ACFO7V_05540 [Glutamicibacter bergerei]|uniref:Uncharacterized protein n=1 Tax=Glutamicibacter bergerei TaxID=256702 RepID=A0ABV9MKS2_9MICC|nr:hypothetical protein [Micrococcaceae bacterium]